MTHTINNSFALEIMERSGQDILSCYQCRKCEAGCPVAEFMDIPPQCCPPNDPIWSAGRIARLFINLVVRRM